MHFCGPICNNQPTNAQSLYLHYFVTLKKYRLLLVLIPMGIIIIRDHVYQTILYETFL